MKYLGQIARSAEQLGFEGALTPDRRVVRGRLAHPAMLTGVTERLKFLVAFRPGQICPTLSAQMASTFQRLSEGPAAAQRRHRRRVRRAACLR